jgi:hypothetical protein
MSNSLTYAGQDAMIHGGASDGGFSRTAAKLKLFASTSTPNKDGTGFTEVGSGNGYVTGGIAISRADWVNETDSGNRRIRLTNKVWTATGGSIPNIAGIFVTDAANVVLGWWERASPITIASGDTFTADAIFVKPT